MFHNKLKSIFKIGISVQNRVCLLITRSSSAAKQKFTNCKGVRIAYTSYGDYDAQKKPPLVLFHGLLGSKLNWDHICDEIYQRTGRMVINSDLRNHGDSEHSPNSTYFHMVQDVVDLLHELELSRVSLLGHSMGGYIGLAMALLRPDLVSSLAIEDISPLRISPRLSGLHHAIDAMMTLSVGTNTSLPEARNIADDHISIAISDVNVRKYLIENLIKTDSGYSWRVNLPVLRDFFVSDDVNFPASLNGLQYTGPTLFIKGAKSDFLRGSDIAEIKKSFPSAELTSIDDVGHHVHDYKTEEFLEVLSRFLKKD